MPQQAQSRSNPRACTTMSLLCLLIPDQVAYGAMMALAFDVGIETEPCFDEAEPIGVVELGTAASQSSSSWESREPSSVYHEPAWIALRVTILGLFGNVDQNCGGLMLPM